MSIYRSDRWQTKHFPTTTIPRTNLPVPFVLITLLETVQRYVDTALRQYKNSRPISSLNRFKRILKVMRDSITAAFSSWGCHWNTKNDPMSSHKLHVSSNLPCSSPPLTLTLSYCISISFSLLHFVWCIHIHTGTHDSSMNDKHADMFLWSHASSVPTFNVFEVERRKCRQVW